MARQPRRVAPLVGALVFLVGTARADHITPMGPGARRYFAPAPAGGGNDCVEDSLARALVEMAQKLAVNARQSPPRVEARLCAMAETLAEHLGPEEIPGLELQEFLLSHFGLGDPLPELAMFQFGMDDETIRKKFAARLPSNIRGGPFGRIGVGIKRRFWGRTSVVVALQRIDVELLPVPRKLGVGESALIAGRLLRGRRDPRVLVAPPRGEVATLAVRGDGDGFQTTFKCNAGAGRYQVEIVGTSYDGKSLVANFPVYCGVDPPLRSARSVVAGPEVSDAKAAEALALAAVNKDRVAVGLPGLAWDPALGRAARDYSEELARRQVVEHVSRESGNAADRVRRAGAKALMVYENVGRASSIADAQRSFMSSPGHRANILARTVTRAGIGVAIRREGDHATVYVTQLFAR